MNSKIAFLVLFTLLSFFNVIVLSTIGASETKIRVDPPSLVNPSLIPGSTFNVNISILDVEDLYSWMFYLTWDPTVLNVTNVQEGNFLRRGGIYNTQFVKNIYNNAGYILVACTLLGGNSSSVASGNGTLATVTFFVKDRGSTTLHLHDTMLLDYWESEISHVTADGYFSNLSEVERHDIAILDVSVFPATAVVGATISINVTIKNEGNRPENFNASIYYDSNFIAKHTNVYLSPGVSNILNFIWNTTSVPHNLYKIKAEVPPVPGEADTTDNTYFSVTITLKIADVNDDGKVNVFDFGALGKAWATTVGHPDYNAAVDFNNDGKIDQEDLHLLAITWGYGS
jgi:hypothetical protein